MEGFKIPLDSELGTTTTRSSKKKPSHKKKKSKIGKIIKRIFLVILIIIVLLMSIVAGAFFGFVDNSTDLIAQEYNLDFASMLYYIDEETNEPVEIDRLY